MSDASPLSALPVELWTKIFKATKDAEEGPLLVGNVKDTPYIISQVCADWRDIILGACPEVWADMKVVMSPGIGGLGLKAWDSLMVLAMECSGSHLLDIEFHGVEHGPNDWNSIHCFQYLLGEGYRWRSATLRIGPRHLPFVNHLNDYCPRIESSSVDLCMSDTSGNTNITAFSLAANLRQLVFKGLGTNAKLDFPVRNIDRLMDTRMRVHSDIHDNVIQRLASASNLQSLELMYGDVFIPSKSIPLPTLLPSVTYLRVTNIHTLEAVCAPDLETLVVAPPRFTYSNIHETELHTNTLSAMCDLIQHSGCYISLHTLEMHNVPPIPSISNLVRLVPWMRVISLGFTRWTGEYDGVFDSLLADLSVSTVDGRGTRRLRWMQDLSSLSLVIDTHRPHSTLFLTDSLVRLIEARVPPDIESPFEFCVELKDGTCTGHPPNLSKDIQDRLDSCQRMGSFYKFNSSPSKKI